MKKKAPEEKINGVKGSVIPAQHGWFAVFKADEEEGPYAVPVLAWRYYDLEDASTREYVCADGLTTPWQEGDDVIDSTSERFAGFRWMPQLYNRPQDKVEGHHAVWTLGESEI